MFAIVQQNTPTVLTPATCKQLELTFQQLSQSHNAPAVPSREDVVVYKPALEVKVENGHSSVGSDFHNDSSTSETWISASQQQCQQGIAGGVVSSPPGFTVANSVAAAVPDKKLSNRPTGPRKPKVEAAVSSLQSIV